MGDGRLKALDGLEMLEKSSQSSITKCIVV